MVDGVNGKQWTKIDNTTQNKEYNNILDKKINSIMNGNETISVEALKKNSLFNNLSEQATTRYNQIANIDGDNTTFNAGELKVLFSLTDAELKNNQFVFDGKDKVDSNSGLEQATDSEVKVMIRNLVKSNAKKRIETVDVSKYDKTKSFEDKIVSDDVDEVMLAVQDKLSVGINKKTGKPMSITQAVLLLKNYVTQEHGYEEGCKAFTDETGISASDFKRLRCSGDGDSFTIGDWHYDRGTIINNKTGEKINGVSTSWRNSTNHTVPASNGDWYRLESYTDGKGNKVKFTYGDDENVAPTSANVMTNGNSKTINYNQKLYIDQDLYNYTEKLSSIKLE